MDETKMTAESKGLRWTAVLGQWIRTPIANHLNKTTIQYMELIIGKTSEPIPYMAFQACMTRLACFCSAQATTDGRSAGQAQQLTETMYGLHALPEMNIGT